MTIATVRPTATSIAAQQEGAAAALTAFLEAWKARDWRGMAMHSQRSWYHMQQNGRGFMPDLDAAGWLEHWLGVPDMPFEVQSFRIIDNGVRMGADRLVPITIRELTVKLETNRGPRRVTVMVVKEDAEGNYVPADSEGGYWGVNPPSVTGALRP